MAWFNGTNYVDGWVIVRSDKEYLGGPGFDGCVHLSHRQAMFDCPQKVYHVISWKPLEEKVVIPEYWVVVRDVDVYNGGPGYGSAIYTSRVAAQEQANYLVVNNSLSFYVVKYRRPGRLQAEVKPAPAAEQEFKVGDVVWLKSGGPAMTITYVTKADGNSTCFTHWFAGGEAKSGQFGAGTLSREKKWATV